MSSPAPAKPEKSATKPIQKMQGHTRAVQGVLCLPDTRRIITCSWDGSLRVWDLERGIQIGNAWKDEGSGGVLVIALSPDGKTVASGSRDGAVRLWDIDTGKVIKKWTGHEHTVRSICWSPDGGRVVSGSDDRTFRVWDVKSGETILGPIEAGAWNMETTVCYSPNGTMIATGGHSVKFWDANTGELLSTLEEFTVRLAWTSDGKTLITAAGPITRFDTATWTKTVLHGHEIVYGISLSPNERILASASPDNTVRLWNLDNNQLIGLLPLHHEEEVQSVTFSADGKFLATGCNDHHVYTWDFSSILKEAGLHDLLSENVNTVKKLGLDVCYMFLHNFIAFEHLHPRLMLHDAKPRKWKAPVYPRGFSMTYMISIHILTVPLTNQFSMLRTSPLSWAQNFLSGMLRRSHVPPVVDFPLTAGQPRNYQAVSSSRPSDPHTVQQHSGATQSNLSSLQQPPATGMASTTLPTATGTAAPTGTNSPPDITRRAGWRMRFMLWVCCVPIQNADAQH